MFVYVDKDVGLEEVLIYSVVQQKSSVVKELVLEEGIIVENYEKEVVDEKNI